MCGMAADWYCSQSRSLTYFIIFHLICLLIGYIALPSDEVRIGVVLKHALHCWLSLQKPGNKANASLLWEANIELFFWITLSYVFAMASLLMNRCMIYIYFLLLYSASCVIPTWRIYLKLYVLFRVLRSEWVDCTLHQAQNRKAANKEAGLRVCGVCTFWVCVWRGRKV